MTTYENPRSLALCLESVAQQSHLPDSICIADDGSGAETANVITAFAARMAPRPVRHVWHEDTGFEKCTILNKAIASSKAEFLLFIDGDVLIHPDFLARHFARAQQGRFSTGSLIRLDDPATRGLTTQEVASGIVFDRQWLRDHRAIDRFGTWLKTMPLPFAVQALLDRLTPVRRALCGANWSAYRQDILTVNGFDETIKYGGLDKELGIRLENAGIKGQHLRYTAPLVHLDHPRGYADPEKIRRHKAIIRAARTSGVAWTEHGLVKGPRNAAHA
jgi:glycosyltransferase involved in cell wall biosynthesis